jgi:hypothetical protein
MAGIAQPVADIAGLARFRSRLEAMPVARAVARYSLSAIGPLAISGAHFAASLIFLHALSAEEFGRFSFLLVVVPFCLSASGALLGAPLATTLGKSASDAARDLSIFKKVNLLFSAFAGLATMALLVLSHASLVLALPLGVYGAAMTLRWFARILTYVRGHPIRAAASDLIYSTLLIGALAGLYSAHALTALSGALVLLGSAACSLLGFGSDYLRRQFLPDSSGSIAGYAHIWRELTRWSLLGVVLTEMTANAHAYFVTFISGPQIYALLALGGLVMRPVSLVLSALPDMERAVMARRIAANDFHGAIRAVNEFRTAAGAIWLATIALAAILMIWFPHVLLKKGYDGTAVMVVIALWAAIMAVRALRTPDAVLLQAAGEFRPLARAGMASSLTSVGVTLLLLIFVGPIASLGGILAGDIAMTAAIFSLTRRWRQDYA